MLRHDSFQQLSNVTLPADYPEVALKLLTNSRYDAPTQIQKNTYFRRSPAYNPDYQSRGCRGQHWRSLCRCYNGRGAVPVLRRLIATVAVESSAAPGRSPGSVSCNLPLSDRLSSLQLNSRRRTLLDQTTRAANLEYDNSRHPDPLNS